MIHIKYIPKKYDKKLRELAMPARYSPILINSINSKFINGIV